MQENCDVRKIMVIGGAGFIGSHLVDLFLAQGKQVLVYDNFSTGKKEFLRNLEKKYIINGDIIDSDCLSSAINEFNPEVVFHLAAIHHIPTCEKNPKKALRTNVEGTVSVFESLNESVKKMVFASTGALYDPSNQNILNENSPLKPTDIYSISKMACENIAEYYSKKNQLAVVVARLFNTVGRRETNRHLIPDIVDQLVEGKREILLGNLTPLRDYIHVEDVADALYLLAQINIDKNLEIFNVGTGVEHSVVDIVNLFSEVIGDKIKVKSVPELKRKIDRPTQKADISKLMSITGWKPKRTLKQALEEVWAAAIKG